MPTEDPNDPLADVETVRGSSPERSASVAADPALTEDLALALLQRNDTLPEIIEEFSKNSALVSNRKVKLAIVAHPKTPRYISISLLRQLFTFDLMKVALTPATAGDIKAAAEEALIKRLESLSSGERMSLARRASVRVAGALLHDQESRVVRTALENPHLTEAVIIKRLLSPRSMAALVHAVCEHPKWSLRREIRIALLRDEKTPIEFLKEFAQSFSRSQLSELLQDSPLAQAVKDAILKEYL
ncbi:MAG: hypothetical protein JOZ80_13915 [Acidobacteriaceae bacterium]|nr:hypothetical protein [Acidobacteriaceae bacterium]